MSFTNFHIKKRQVLLIVMMLALFALGRLFQWPDDISGGKTLNVLRQLAEEHMMAAILLYSLLTVIGCVALALPGITFAVLAGLVFGPVLGTVCCAAATTAGAMGAFLAGRFFLKDSVKPMAMKNWYLRRWLFDESGKNELFLLMITRLVPLFPFNLQNFAYGVTDISFGTFSIFSFLFMLPGTAMYTFGAAGMADQENRLPYITIALALAGDVMGTGICIKKKYRMDGSEREERRTQ